MAHECRICTDACDGERDMATCIGCTICQEVIDERIERENDEQEDEDA